MSPTRCRFISPKSSRGCSRIFGGKSVRRDTVPPQRSSALRPPLAAQKKKGKEERKNLQRGGGARGGRRLHAGESVSPPVENFSTPLSASIVIYARDEGGYGPLYTGFETRGVIQRRLPDGPRSSSTRLQRILESIPSSPLPILFKRIPPRFEEDAFDGRGLLWTKVISDVTLYIYIYI